jgi:hypothetical protein
VPVAVIVHVELSARAIWIQHADLDHAIFLTNLDFATYLQRASSWRHPSKFRPATAA